MYVPIDVEGGRRIPELVGVVRNRNDEIFELELQLKDFAFLNDLQEQDNYRLRRFMVDLKHRYEDMVQKREWEIENLSGRVLFLEEELFNVQKRPQQEFMGQMRDDYDPQRVRDLERMLALKDEEIDQLNRKVRNLQDRSDILQ